MVLLQEVVSDNRPPYFPFEYKPLKPSMHLPMHTTSNPRHPQNNGKVMIRTSRQ